MATLNEFIESEDTSRFAHGIHYVRSRDTTVTLFAVYGSKLSYTNVDCVSQSQLRECLQDYQERKVLTNAEWKIHDRTMSHYQTLDDALRQLATIQNRCALIYGSYLFYMRPACKPGRWHVTCKDLENWEATDTPYSQLKDAILSRILD